MMFISARKEAVMKRTGFALIALVGLGAPAWAQMSPEQMAEQQAQSDAPGTNRIQNFYTSMGSKGAMKDWYLELNEGRCYWFSGAGNEGITELGLFLWDPAKKRVADKKSKKSPLVMMNYCPTANGIYHLQGKVLGGSGMYAIGIYAKGAPPATPPPALPPPKTATPAPTINLTPLLEKEAKATAPGSSRQGEVLEGSSGGDRNDWSIMMEQGTCYWVIGVGEPKKIKELSLYLWSPANKRITESRSTNDKATIGHCPAETGMFKIQAKIHKGEGAYAVAIYAKGKK
jgi:hypothetical protein